MKHSLWLPLLLLVVLSGCSEDAMERLVFEQTIKYKLLDICKEDQSCITAVEQQLSACIEQSDYRKLLRATGSAEAAEQVRFSQALYSCIVDADGNPQFEYRG